MSLDNDDYLDTAVPLGHATIADLTEPGAVILECLTDDGNDGLEIWDTKIVAVAVTPG